MFTPAMVKILDLVAHETGYPEDIAERVWPNAPDPSRAQSILVELEKRGLVYMDYSWQITLKGRITCWLLKKVM